MLSKIANWIAWSALTLLVVFLVYRYTDWFKPAADHAVSEVKSAVSQVVPHGPFGKGNAEDQLNQARDAYAKGDVESAIAGYKEYIKNNPSNPDASGELGNVYYTAGRLQEAAQSYYDAANLLIEQKQQDRAEELIPVISQINPSLVNDLMGKLSQADMQAAPEVQQADPDQQPPGAPQSALRYY